MRLSVIIPVYNARDYIIRCVSSIRPQLLQTDEIILVDDGSTDGSTSLCDELADEDSIIKVIHQSNQGASIARRNGIKGSSGDYILFVDSDDYVEPDYIACLYNSISRNDVEFAACDYVSHYENETIDIVRLNNDKILEEAELHDRFFKYDFWGFCGKIYKRAVFNDLFFPQATVNEDYLVMAQIFSVYKRMAYIPIPLYHYIRHENSLSNQSLCSRMFDEFDNKLWVLNFYKTNNKKYVGQAEAQLIETCLKLLIKTRKNDKKNRFSNKTCEIKNFARKNIMNVLFNKYVLIKQKILLFWFLL